MLGIIIQARSRSKRLPYKCTTKIYKNQTLLDVVIKRIKKVFKDTTIVVATTLDRSDKEICKIAEENGVDWYRGPENNVLKRFIDCSRCFGFNDIIRVCADNPFIEPKTIKTLIRFSEWDHKYDYIVHTIRGKNVIWEGKFGFFAEYVTLGALKRIYRKTQDKKYLEHVTLFIHDNPNMFKICNINSYLRRFINDDSFKLSIDYKKELEFIKIIIKNVGIYATPLEVIQYIKNGWEFAWEKCKKHFNTIKKIMKKR